MLKLSVTTWNPSVLWNGRMFELGLDITEFIVTVFPCVFSGESLLCREKVLLGTG